MQENFSAKKCKEVTKPLLNQIFIAIHRPRWNTTNLANPAKFRTNTGHAPSVLRTIELGKLTNRAIESARAKAKPYKLMDGEGLQLRVGTTGEKSWLVRYFVDKREKQYRLPGAYGIGPGYCSLSEARDKAREIHKLAREGRDYAVELRNQLHNEALQLADAERQLNRPTVSILFNRWSEHELSSQKDGGVEVKRGIEKDVISKIGNRFVDEIQRADILEILDAVVARGAKRMATRLRSELRQMFKFAMVREIIDKDPTGGIEKRQVGGRDTERDRTLSESEIRLLPAKLMSANLLDTTEHAIWVMLATMARIGELTGARRRDIDIENSRWTIPGENSKNGKEHTIHLSEFAKEHLTQLLLKSDDDIWLFPASNKDGPICKKSITKQLYDRQRGVPKTNGTMLTSSLCLPGGRWTPHDLRRTGATLMGELGVYGDVIEKCLNHVEQNKVKRTYQHARREEEQRNAWRLLGDRLTLLVQPTANIAIFHQRIA